MRFDLKCNKLRPDRKHFQIVCLVLSAHIQKQGTTSMRPCMLFETESIDVFNVHTRTTS